MTNEQAIREQYEFFRNLYIETAKAHEEVIRMCKEGASLDDIRKVASSHIRIEGV